MSVLKLVIILCFCSAIVGVIVLVAREIIKKNVHIWLPSYFINSIKPRPKNPPDHPLHVMFAIADHFEPLWNHATAEQERMRVNAWTIGYPETVRGHVDADGKCPQHTWFYPIDEYRHAHLEELTKLCSSGHGEIELHLHHDGDTSEGLREKFQHAKRTFSKYGALVTSESNPVHIYGFVHGNWSLDNSRRDGKWCGVNNELQILAQTGCYADFTMPSAPSETQSRKINSIYYATDDPDKPKSYNAGTDVEVNKQPSGDLMMIQGPLCLNWRRRKALILPKIENGNITSDNPPTADRVDLWIKQHIHVRGRPDWIFVKLYTHGAQDRNCEALLGTGGHLDSLYSYLEDAYNDGIRYRLHYVAAREMYNIIKAAEAGAEGNPNRYRDYVIPPYVNKNVNVSETRQGKVQKRD